MNMAAAPALYRTYFLGDSCLCASLGNSIERLIALRILSVYRRLQADANLQPLGIHDLVPSYTALALHGEPWSDWQKIRRLLDGHFKNLSVKESELRQGMQRHVLPVSYQGEDLPRVAQWNGITVPEVIERHAAVEYMVAMIGFRPHFPYLLGLDRRLITPRLDTPRLKVPAGAVAIGGEQTGVYPEISPGGWNIVGLTDPRLLPAIRPGDTIVFRRQP
ncbi:MAG: carboxyltransferase domain-containing protein [Chrysiogenales bacterium]|nr:allophanate hydrolase subunit 1 [Candidatus Aminicenantes bacterium]TFG80893.1 MAG: carboxyltransferase domain-containing protein [Chrysiogenales bacterium]